MTLNLIGLGLQILGVVVVAYSVRKVAFKKKGMFDSSMFDPAIFDTSTTSDSAPIDKKTNKLAEELTTIDPNGTIIGVTSIVAGLVIQMVAVFTPQTC